jgi:hypothetical protein
MCDCFTCFPTLPSTPAQCVPRDLCWLGAVSNYYEETTTRKKTCRRLSCQPGPHSIRCLSTSNLDLRIKLSCWALSLEYKRSYMHLYDKSVEKRIMGWAHQSLCFSDSHSLGLSVTLGLAVTRHTRSLSLPVTLGLSVDTRSLGLSVTRSLGRSLSRSLGH